MSYDYINFIELKYSDDKEENTFIQYDIKNEIEMHQSKNYKSEVVLQEAIAPLEKN